MKPKAALRHFLALAGSSLLAVSSASAQSTYTWANSNVTNTPTTLDWFTGGPNTQATWTGGTPVSSNLNTIQFFANTTTPLGHTASVIQGSNLNNGGTAFQLGTLTLSGLATNSSNQTLTMNVTGDALNFSAATGTINLDTVSVPGNGRNITWNVSNAIQLGAAGSASNLTLTGSGNSTYNFSGSFTELQAGGGSKLIKSGTTLTTLSGAVTVSGGLEVNGGTLRLTNASNAITGGITLNGGTLGDNNGRITTQTLNNNLITVNGAANLGMEGGTTTNGGITLNSGANLTLATNASSATVNGAVTGVGSISIGQLGGGGHTQNLNSTANTFTGTISFTAATHAATLNINSLLDSASLGAGNIRFVGSAGTNAHTFALGSGAIAPVTLNNRQIEIVSGSAAAYTVSNNSSQAFTINTDLLVGATGARTLTLGGTGTGLSTFGGKIENGSGTVSITKAGSGTWLFSGNNTYTGTTTVSAGILNTTKAAALPGYNSAAKVIFNGGTLGVQVGGSGWTTGEVDTLLTNATKTSGALGIDTTNGSLTQWTAFTTTNLGSALGINKLGTNTLTLDQSNTFAGALTISQGTVSINTINNASSNGVLGNSANAVVLGSSGNTGTLLYTGATASSTKTFTAATSGTGAINIQEAATELTLSGAIGGSGNIIKEGAGILTLGAANGYSGDTTVNGGQLRWGITNAIAGNLTVNNGGTANIQTFSDTVGTITIAQGGSITGTSGTFTTSSFISNNGGTMTGATLVLANNASVTYNSTGPGSTTLQIEKLSVNDSGTNVFNIADGDASVDFDITGAVNNGGSNVSRTITKSGAGAMQFSGSTLGTAGQNGVFLNINEGTVLMNRGAGVSFAPGSSHAITIGDGTGSSGSAILKFASTGGDNQLGNRAITINSDGLFDLNSKQTTIGALTLNASTGNTTTVSLGSTGILTLGGDVTLNAVGTGQAQITGSELSLGAANRIFNIGLGSGADYDLLVGAGITGARTLTKTGAGRLVLTGSNNYSLGTSIVAGTLQIGDGTTAGTMTSTGALTMGGGTFAVRGPASGGSSQSVASLATTASTGSIIRLTPGASGNTTLTITSGTASTGAGSSLNFDYTGGTTVGGTVGNNSVVWNTTLTAGIIGGAYTVTDSGGTGFATKNGSNVVIRLTDPGSAGLPVSTGSATGSYFVNSNYSTGSTTTPGSLVEALSGAVAASNVTVNTTGLTSGANLALGTNLLTLGAGMVFDGPNAYEISGSGAGGLRAAASGGTINLYNSNTSTVTISAPIVANGASRLTVDGPGTTILSGVNTYTGATLVNGGTVRFAGTMAASPITINNGVAQLGTTTGLTSSNTVTFGAGATGSLQLLGNNLTIGALSSNATLGAPVVTNNNGGPSVGNATLTIDSGSGSTFGGVIQDGTGGGTLALVKSGAGTLTLSGVNTYSGGTTINAGILSVTSDAFLGNASGGITLNGGRLFSNGGNLNMARNITVTGTGSSIVVNKNNNFSTSGTLTGSGSLAFVNPGGSGTTSIYNFTSTGNTFTGAMSLDLADVRVSSLGDAAGNNIVFTTNAGSTFSLNSTGVTAGLTFNNRAIELSNLSGTVSNNNATHAITIGTNLVATGAGAKVLTLSAASGPTNVFSGNITNGTGGGTVGITKSGAGRWMLSGSSNSYTGGTTVSAGTLIMTSPANLGNSALNVGGNTFIYSPTSAGALNIGSGVLTLSGTIGTAVGGTASQSAITSTGTAVLSGTTGKVNIYGITGASPTAGVNNLITAAAGLDGGTFTLGTVYNNTDFTVSAISRSATAISTTVTAATPISGGVYWKGGLSGNTGVWSASTGLSGGTSNWQVTDGVNQPLAPGASADLIFSTSTSPGTMAGMTLGSNVTVRSVTVNNTATAFGLTNDGYSLTITPASSSSGITIGSGVQASTIATNVVLGANQTWTNNSTNALTVSGNISGSSVGITKSGAGTIVLSGTNTYTGATTVDAGTLYVTGSLGSSQVIVKANGTIGSSGGAGSRSLGNGLNIEAGGNLDFTGASLGLNSTDILSLTGGSLTLGNLTFQDIVGWDWANAAPGTYELIDGSFSIDWGSTAYLDPATAYDFGNGNKGYFTAGSLNAVIVAIPEPGAALLGGLGILLILRRRR